MSAVAALISAPTASAVALSFRPTVTVTGLADWDTALMVTPGSTLTKELVDDVTEYAPSPAPIVIFASCAADVWRRPPAVENAALSSEREFATPAVVELICSNHALFATLT